MPATRLMYEEPLVIVRASGLEVTDTHGRQYYDFYNNVPSLGYANEAVRFAVSRQLGSLNVNSRFVSPLVTTFVDRTLEIHSASLDSAVLTCSGSEANDLALQVARAVTGRRGVICSDLAYHGNTSELRKVSKLALQIQPRSDTVAGFPLSHFNPSDITDEGSSAFGELLTRSLKVIRTMAGSEQGLAALLVCPLLANEGYPMVAPRLLRELGSEAQRLGALVVCDEVQSGYLRTGAWWGYQNVGLEPDIVTFGKPAGNGYPTAGILARGEVLKYFASRSSYFNSFAGTGAQAAAGLAVLDEIARLGIESRVEALGASLRNLLTQILRDSGLHNQVMGRGLFTLIEITDGYDNERCASTYAMCVVERVKERGFLISTLGERSRVLKIRPPLIVSENLIRDFAHAFASSLSEYKAS